MLGRFLMGTPTEAGTPEPDLRPQPEETTIPGMAMGEPDPAIPPNLAIALRELSEAEATALENDSPVPSAGMLEDTKVLLLRLYEAYPYQYAVYPSRRGDMVIYARPEYGRGIMLVRRADGRAWCSVCVPEKPEGVDYEGEGTIPADALREAVAVLNGREKL